MGLLSKMSDWINGWMDEYSLDCYYYKSTCGAKNRKDKDLHHVELLLKVSPTYQLSGSQHVLVTALQQTLIEKYFNQHGPGNFCPMSNI